MTQQHQKDETDVNKIMARYVKTGIIDHVNRFQPHYGDTSPISYHESLSICARAQSMFQELPAIVRKKFHNDPEQFLEFVQDPENKDKLFEMGLSETPPPEKEEIKEPPKEEITTTKKVETKTEEPVTTEKDPKST